MSHRPVPSNDIADILAGTLMVSRGTALDIMRDTLATTGTQCQWRQADTISMPDTWEADCGAAWTFTDGGPKDNSMKFCPQCGHPLKQIDNAMTHKNDHYASEAETQALLAPDTRTEAERKLDEMMDELGAWEQGAEPYPLLRHIALELLKKQLAEQPAPVRYQRRERGEGDWMDCTKEQYEKAMALPEWDTRVIATPQPPAQPSKPLCSPGGHHPMCKLAEQPAQQQEPVATFDEVWNAIDWDKWRMEPIRELVRMIHSKTSRQPSKPLDAVYGDVLPPIGSRVFIRHGRDNAAHACTVTGYYAWPAHGGDKNVHRVFVRMVYEGTDTQQARLLCDCYPTEEAAHGITGEQK